MPFFDTPFKQTVPYNINVDNATGGRVAITILRSTSATSSRLPSSSRSLRVLERL